MVEELEKKIDQTDEWLETQWYRRSDAIKYELDDLREQYEKVSQYADEFTDNEMETFAWCERKIQQYEDEMLDK